MTHRKVNFLAPRWDTGRGTILTQHQSFIRLLVRWIQRKHKLAWRGDLEVKRARPFRFRMTPVSEISMLEIFCDRFSVTLTQNHLATTCTPQWGYSSSQTKRRWLGRFVTQVTTKQLGDAKWGTGSRFSWVDGKKLYLHWENWCNQCYILIKYEHNTAKNGGVRNEGFFIIIISVMSTCDCFLWVWVAKLEQFKFKEVQLEKGLKGPEGENVQLLSVIYI